MTNLSRRPLGPRAAVTYRGARRNLTRGKRTTAQLCKAERLANGETRSQFDRRRWDELQKALALSAPWREKPARPGASGSLANWNKSREMARRQKQLTS
jgi:hypothetical protein